MAMNKTFKFGDSKLRWGALEAMDALTQVNTLLSFNKKELSQCLYS